MKWRQKYKDIRSRRRCTPREDGKRLRLCEHHGGEAVSWFIYASLYMISVLICCLCERSEAICTV